MIAVARTPFVKGQMMFGLVQGRSQLTVARVRRRHAAAITFIFALGRQLIIVGATFQRIPTVVRAVASGVDGS